MDVSDVLTTPLNKMDESTKGKGTIHKHVQVYEQVIQEWIEYSWALEDMKFLVERWPMREEEENVGYETKGVLSRKYSKSPFFIFLFH